MYLIQGYEYITFEWIMVTITFLIVLIRLYVRIYLHGPIFDIKTYRISELFVVLGWLLFLGITICNSLGNSVGGKNINPGFKRTEAQNIYLLKIKWAWSWQYKQSTFAMRAALLCFYMELVTKKEYRSLWRAVIATQVLNALGSLTQVLFIWLQCTPFSLQWSIKDQPCQAILSYPIITWGSVVLTDLIVFILPFFILRAAQKKRHLSNEQMKGAYFMFGLGVLNVASALVLFALRLQSNHYNGRVVANRVVMSINLLYTVHISTAIVIPCCPQVRVFYKNFARRRASISASDRYRTSSISSSIMRMKNSKSKVSGFFHWPIQSRITSFSRERDMSRSRSRSESTDGLQNGEQLIRSNKLVFKIIPREVKSAGTGGDSEISNPELRDTCIIDSVFPAPPNVHLLGDRFV